MILLFGVMLIFDILVVITLNLMFISQKGIGLVMSALPSLSGLCNC